MRESHLSLAYNFSPNSTFRGQVEHTAPLVNRKGGESDLTDYYRDSTLKKDANNAAYVPKTLNDSISYIDDYMKKQK